MFKKLLNLFNSDKEEEKPKSNTQSQQKTYSHPADDDDDDDEDSDDDDDFDDDDDEDDDDDPMYNFTDPSESKGAHVELDPETLHGKNYTIEEFDAEVERRVQKQIKEEQADGEEPDEYDIKDYKFNHRREVYLQWTGANTEQMIAWENKHSFEQTGVHAFGATAHDENNPLLQPIHGITLQDFAAIAYYLGTGMDMDTMLKALGAEKALWDEANVLWTKRMQEDTTFAVVNLYGKYFQEAEKHPKLSAAKPEVSEKGAETLQRMKEDRHFFIDVQAELNAAYEYGIDGAQQMLDKYGIHVGDMATISAYYTEVDGSNYEQTNHFAILLDKKMKEYADKYAQEQGGNIADDIEF